MGIDLNAAKELAKRYMEYYEQVYPSKIHKTLEWFEMNDPNGKGILKEFGSKKYRFILNENPFCEREEYFAFNYSAWIETSNGLEDARMAGGGPILVDRLTSNIYPLGKLGSYSITGNPTEDIEIRYQKIRNALAGKDPNWQHESVLTWIEEENSFQRVS